VQEAASQRLILNLEEGRMVYHNTFGKGIINKFDKNGLIAGCHNIPKTEIDYILNLI
jgi:hypothetical protein